MSKTIEQKLTDRILAIVDRHYFYPAPYLKHLIVRTRSLKVVRTLGLQTCDTYVIKLTNRNGLRTSRQSISFAVECLNRRIALTPLLKKPKRRKKS